MGTVVMGKAESGSVSEGDSLMVMPNKVQLYILIYIIYISSNASYFLRIDVFKC